jgi:hypothetical protein
MRRRTLILTAAVLLSALTSGATLAGEEHAGPHLFPAGAYVLGGRTGTARGKDAARIDDRFALHPDQYVLSGGPEPTDPIVIDDDLELLLGGEKLFIDDDHVRAGDGRGVGCTYNGEPILLRLPAGAALRVRALDCAPTEAILGALWLHRWDGAKRRLTGGVKERSNPALPHVFFEAEFQVGDGFDPAPVYAPPSLTQARLDHLWDDLGGKDPAREYVAVWALAASPGQSVPFLRERMRPADAPDDVTSKKAAKLTAQLDDDDFDVRERATAELARLGKAARPALRAALAGKPSAEARQRIEKLLQPLDEAGLSPEERRLLRAVEALEYAGVPEANKALEALAGGAAGDPLTEHAREALARLAKRAKAP